MKGSEREWAKPGAKMEVGLNGVREEQGRVEGWGAQGNFVLRELLGI